MALPLYFIFVALTSISSTTLSAAQNGAGGNGGSSSGVAVELWCVAKNNAEDTALQTALDWACGQGGADCSAIQQGGPCYDAKDIQKTASFAFNDYFLKHGLTQDSCNFDNTAALTSINPSYGSCRFPSSKTAGSGNFTGGLGPTTADINSSSSFPEGWNWSLMIIHLCYAVSLLL
ncbi:hypothetical protein ACH5RR_028644 [Cinchona calisaya]|uniref:X8 domain-containing protein n=1 Tax=Cinchona calisaya TaxID=153742 RepID=A0ABD2YQL0_9GENT